MRERTFLVNHSAPAARPDYSREVRLILTLVPATIGTLHGAGNWKDIQSLHLLLDETRQAHTSLSFEDDDPMGVIDSFPAPPDQVIVHYSFWSELLAAIRRRFPLTRVLLRAHNAEAWHHWHRTAEEPRRLRNAYGVARLLMRDAACRRRCDAILGISDWDNRHYWSRLPGRAEILDVPYSSPWPYLRPQVRPPPWEERRTSVVCLAGGGDRISRTSIEGFSALARAFQRSNAGSAWTFLLSPGVLARAPLPPSAPITVLADVPEPWDLLCSAKAVAVLTPLGYGAKTTIVDGLAAGCHVLAHPSLAPRLPAEIRDACLFVDPTRHDSDQLAEQLSVPPTAGRVNSTLRERARAGLRRALQIDD